MSKNVTIEKGAVKVTDEKNGKQEKDKKEQSLKERFKNKIRDYKMKKEKN